MAVYWSTEAIPLAVTSLLPAVLFPLLGTLSTSQVAAEYTKVSIIIIIIIIIIIRPRMINC